VAPTAAAALPASQSFTVSKAATTLGAVKGDKHILGGSVTFFATLSRTDKAPIAGETIAFSVRSGHACSAKTASDGTATCSVRIGILRGLFSQSFTAVYAGSANYKAISATGPLNAVRG
jgi:hypothetical protein